MSLIGKKIENFTAQAYQNEEFREVSFEKDFLGKWNVVVFYPADFTFVCPTELEDLEDHRQELEKLGFNVYSVSTDTHFTHKAWHDHSEAIGKVKFTMIGDPTKAISREFEVLNEESGLAYRGTFIINPEGKIVAYEVNDEGIGRDASELVRRAKAAKFVADNPGLVCPAKRKEGEATLKPGLDLVGKI
ncbi:peroxiredoxin [Leptotrichia wadei]|uniref:Alkyl hydroperoxide reductase C n=1 Tax=Leptotrichia wadei TaxID=157687 RepID=A0A134AA39_9FUSO|nr:alkyl hydroperoxide reductase subunit C [Leptotrichia wadei]KXB64538.1 peroxiredoxin [Leptotrichia wadei]